MSTMKQRERRRRQWEGKGRSSNENRRDTAKQHHLSHKTKQDPKEGEVEEVGGRRCGQDMLIYNAIRGERDAMTKDEREMIKKTKK